MYEQSRTFATSLFAIVVDQSEQSIVTVDQSEQSIESADQSQNGILTKTVFGSSAGAGHSLLLVSKPGVVVQEDSAGVHSEPRPGELRQAPGPRPRAQQLVVASGHLNKKKLVTVSKNIW